MAACGVSQEMEAGPAPGLGKAQKLVLNVRVVEAAGLTRHTNLKGIKSVTIHDPMCTVQLRDVGHKYTTKKAYKTKSIKSTCFPLWDYNCSMNVHIEDFQKSNSVIRFHVEGAQRLGTENLGVVDLLLPEVFEQCTKSSTGCWQKWFQLDKRSPPATTLGGALLVSMSVTQKKAIPKVLNFEQEEKSQLQTGILIGTMNCGNAAPPDNISKWLTPDPTKHEIVAVGCQECQWKTAEEEKESCESIWEKALRDGLNAKTEKSNPYRTLMVRSMAEMRLFIFVLRSCIEQNKITHLAMYQEATGLGHVYGNKGGCISSFDFGGTSLCFINTHLAAHQNETERRNKDYIEVCTPNGCGNVKQEILEQFHHVFWMGDLNYRVDYKKDQQPEKSPPKELFNEYLEFINKGNYDSLLKHDQLTRCRMEGQSFYLFNEAHINFKPTFKVMPDEPYTYQEKRSPSWCDRVLWRSADSFEKDIVCTAYTNCGEILSSDHKPVSAKFAVRTWPRAPGKVDPPTLAKVKKNQIKATLKFRKVAAADLPSADLGGKSDPYIHFSRQELLGKFDKSNKVKNNNNPKWKDKDLPTLELQRNNPQFLEKAILLFQVKDHDMMTKSDRIASGCIALGPVAKAPGTWVSFDRKLSRRGLPAGSITGEYCLTYTGV